MPQGLPRQINRAHHLGRDGRTEGFRGNLEYRAPGNSTCRVDKDIHVLQQRVHALQLHLITKVRRMYRDRYRDRYRDPGASGGKDSRSRGLECRRIARTGFIDTIATMLAGRNEPVVQIVRRLVAARESESILDPAKCAIAVI